MELFVVVLVLGAAAFGMFRRGQLWMPLACVLLMGMSLVAGSVRGTVYHAAMTTLHSGMSLSGTLWDNLRKALP